MPKPPLAPELPDRVVEDILLRLPPDEPASLVRASLVSKPWLGLLSGPGFRSRYRAFHRTPPMLGFLHNVYYVACYVPTTAFCPPGPGHRRLHALDARHGRVLFSADDLDAEPAGDEEFIVWDPITHGQWIIPLPESCPWYTRSYSAVLCAADGCNHLDCHGHPFLVAFVYIDDDGLIFSARLYSSEAAAWSDKTSVEHRHGELDLFFCTPNRPSVLVGNALYFNCGEYSIIVRYDLVGRELSVIDWPGVYAMRGVLMRADDGALGFAVVQESSIYLWSREVDAHGAAAWAQRRVIKLETLLPPRALSTTPSVFGFAEGVGVILLRTKVGVFTIELKSGRVRKVCNLVNIGGFAFPYMSFYNNPGHATGIMSLPPMASSENVEVTRDDHSAINSRCWSKDFSIERGSG